MRTQDINPFIRLNFQTQQQEIMVLLDYLLELHKKQVVKVICKVRPWLHASSNIIL